MVGSASVPDASDKFVVQVRKPKPGIRQVKWFKSFEDGDKHWDRLYLGFKDTTNPARARVNAALHTFRFVEDKAKNETAKKAAKRAPKLPSAESFSGDEIKSESGSEDEDFSHPDGTQDRQVDENPAVHEYKELLLNSYLRDFFRGRGYTTVLNPPKLPSGMDWDALTAGLSRLGLSLGPEKSLRPPRFDFMKEGDQARIKAIVAGMRGESERFCRYMSDVTLGLVGFFGFAGSGKTHILAQTAMIYLAHKHINRVYVSGPTHNAVGNVAQRIRLVGEEIANDDNSLPLVVRGYKKESEMTNLIRLVEDPDSTDDRHDPWEPAPRWNLDLSLCHWLLRVLQVGKWDLAGLEKSSLFQIRKDFMENDDCKELRRFVSREIKFADIEEQEAAATLQGAEGENDDDVVESTPSSYSALWGLMKRILECADFVCTTPYAAQENPYKQICKKADAVVLDEAGAMAKTDALIVWGPFHRPCAMAGDEKQLPPAVMEKVKNKFFDDARVSILEHLKMTGHPCFTLDVQYRIATGLFDCKLPPPPLLILTGPCTDLGDCSAPKLDLSGDQGLQVLIQCGNHQPALGCRHRTLDPYSLQAFVTRRQGPPRLPQLPEK